MHEHRRTLAKPKSELVSGECRFSVATRNGFFNLKLFLDAKARSPILKELQNDLFKI